MSLLDTFWEVFEDRKPLVSLVILNRVRNHGKQALEDYNCNYSFKLVQVEKINIQPEKGGKKSQLWKTRGSKLVNLLHHKAGMIF